MKRVIIYSPLYQRNSAGIYCLYKLAEDLKNKGHMVFTTIWNSNAIFPSVFNVPIIPNIVASQLIQYYDFSVIYPEVISGNPLQAKNVIRWVMNKPQTFGVGDSHFNDNEHVFLYDKSFLDEKDHKIDGMLTLPTIDVDLFKYDPNLQKEQITVYTGKQEFKQGFIDKYDNLITRTSPSHDEVAKILKQTKILYSFDCVTNLVNEARLAGCNVVLIDDGNLKNKDHISEYGDFGIKMFGDKLDIIDPKQIYDNIYRHILINEDVYHKQLDQLIEIL